MKRYSILAGIGLLLSWSALAQTKPEVNTALQQQLIEMGKEDQKHRQELSELMNRLDGPDKDKVMPRYIQLVEEQSALDDKLLRQLEAIIAKHGWPTISLVGKEASGVAFLIIQHADLEYQKKYFPLLKEAADKNEARKSDVAMLEDRILMREGKKQIYGSQLRMNEQTQKLELYPIEDEENVDKRRARVGLMPMKEYMKHFNLEYVPPKKPEQTGKKGQEKKRANNF
jgi:hypothetical protein